VNIYFLSTVSDSQVLSWLRRCPYVTSHASTSKVESQLHTCAASPMGLNTLHFAITESLELLAHASLKLHALELPQILRPLSTLPQLSNLYLSALVRWHTFSNNTIFLSNLGQIWIN